MFESGRERVLLVLVLLLLAALLVDSLVVSPLYKYVTVADVRIAALKDKIAQDSSALEAASARQAEGTFDQQIRLGTEQDQNEFRQYLESKAGLDVVRSSTPKKMAELPGYDNIRLLTYDLELVGSVQSMRVFLENLDASERLLRIDNLHISRGVLEDEERKVKMKMTVSTITRKVEES